MSKQGLSLEAQRSLPEATYGVSVLFRGELGRIFLNPSFPENRKAFWLEIADKYQPFKQKIKDLHQALDTSYSWWVYTRPLDTNPWADGFKDVSDEDAKALLCRLLIPRSATNLSLARYHQPSAEIIKAEERAMLGELGQPPIDQITLGNVVRAILVDDLKLELKEPPEPELESGMSVMAYQKAILQLVNLSARILLSGEKVENGVINPMRAAKLADLLTKAVDYDLNEALHPEFREALEEIRLPFSREKLENMPLPPGEGPK